MGNPVRGEMRARFAGLLDMLGPATQAAAARLFDDPRMANLWAAGLSEATAFEAVNEFAFALNRDEWDKKPQRERDAWAIAFEKAVDQVLKLAEEGPHPPFQWGFPARDNVLMNVAVRLGIEVPPPDTQEFFSTMLRLERAVDAENWTIADALNNYREQQRANCTAPQILQKPREAMAGRAHFVRRLGHQPGLSAADIALIWSVMAEDEAIDARQVRRYLRTGSSSITENLP